MNFESHKIAPTSLPTISCAFFIGIIVVISVCCSLAVWIKVFSYKQGMLLHLLTVTLKSRIDNNKL